MCGPFAIMIGTNAPTRRRLLIRQCVYSFGRVFTYITLGTVAGFIGLRANESMSRVVDCSAALSIMAGMLLAYQGGVILGWFPVVRFFSTGISNHPCTTSSPLVAFLRGTALRDIFLAGVFTGFLPCGLVYGFLGLAASSSSPLTGGLTMLAFGIGTIPVMVVTGIGGSWVSDRSRDYLFRFAAYCVICVGILTVGRGIAFISRSNLATPAEACPFCSTEDPTSGPIHGSATKK